MKEHELQKELGRIILLVTLQILNECPALYEHLNETPLFISYKETQLQSADFKNYLESLNSQLALFHQQNSVVALN